MSSDEGFKERLLASRTGRRQKTLKLEGNPRRRLPGLGLRLMRKLELFRSLMEKRDIPVRIDPSEYARELYFRLGLGVQRRIVNHFSDYVDLIYSLDKKGIDIADSRRFLWAFLSQNGLMPSSDVFLSLKESHVIEIYNKDSIQIFRNLNFLRNYDCSVFDLLVLDWMTVFKRQSLIEEQIFLQIDSGFKLAPRVYKFKGLEPHRLKYRFDDEARELVVDLDFMSPLINRRRKRKTVEGVLVAGFYELEADSADLGFMRLA